MSNNKKLQDDFVVKQLSTGKRTLCGIASAYDDRYPVDLENIISKVEFDRIMFRVNDTIHW